MLQSELASYADPMFSPSAISETYKDKYIKGMEERLALYQKLIELDDIHGQKEELLKSALAYASVLEGRLNITEPVKEEPAALELGFPAKLMLESIQQPSKPFVADYSHDNAFNTHEDFPVHEPVYSQGPIVPAKRKTSAPIAKPAKARTPVKPAPKKKSKSSKLVTPTKNKSKIKSKTSSASKRSSPSRQKLSYPPAPARKT